MFRHYRIILRVLVINAQVTQLFQIQLLVIQFKFKSFTQALCNISI
jgi:hypothetical protein